MRLKSFIEVDENSDFPLENIPFGIGDIPGSGPRICTRIGDTVIDLNALSRMGYFDNLGRDEAIFESSTLNAFIAKGRPFTCRVRSIIMESFMVGGAAETEQVILREMALYHFEQVKMLMPLHIGDYTDFYSSIEHATNVGKMLRDPENALLPNWKHIPVGYHGRASSIIASGASVHRPQGQTKPADKTSPVFGPSAQLDFELETAFVIGKETSLGHPVPITSTDEYIFGMLLFNDLSARDIQSWEYVPLGPFLSKNFASVVSPWVVTIEALQPFRVQGPVQEPEVLPYLRIAGKNNYDLNLEVLIQPEGKQEIVVCQSNFKYMYWSMNQQLAHHTVNGCNIRVGDLYASGTISGPEPGSYGSMLELSWKGTQPIELSDGSKRTFIQDNDTVIIRGYCKNENLRIGFGEARVTILPAIS
ncbi:MAG: fumarylacetoacetase [Bacteroidales bacterium]|nr:fumarylacetoacetase [Bacteroidales bacterium]